MKVSRQALMVARIEAGQATLEEKARVMAWDRLYGMLSTLDSKVSVLLRFNAIVVAALAYVVVVRASDPFAEANTTVKLMGMIVGHRVPGWDAMSVTEAAQHVQRSAAPDAYASWEPQARVLARILTGEVSNRIVCRSSCTVRLGVRSCVTRIAFAPGGRSTGS